jgi:tetratricopeptide (TPR) repeat protein
MDHPVAVDPDQLVLRVFHARRDSVGHQTIAHNFDLLPGPPSAGPRLAARLDRLADAWAAARTASCKAHGRRDLSTADLGARASCQNAVLLQQAGLLERVVATPAAALTRADAGIDELEDALRRCERPPVMALYRGPRPQVAARIELAQVDLAIALGDGSWAQAVAHAAREPAVDRETADRLRLPVQTALAWGSWLRGQDLRASSRLTEISPGDDKFGRRRARRAAPAHPRRRRPRSSRRRRLALTAYRELLGPDDRRLVRIHRELARRRRLAGDLAAAVTEIDAALAILREPDPDDPLHATLLQDLADLEHLRGDYRSAQLHHRAALVIRERAFGADQLPTAESQFGLGSDHEALAELPVAIDHYVRALEIQRVLAPDDLATARTYNNLGRALYAGRNFADARRFHTAALAIRQRTLGAQHPDVATSLNNLGAVARAEGDLPGAMKLFLRALDLRERLLGADHPYTAISLNNIAENPHRQR